MSRIAMRTIMITALVLGFLAVLLSVVFDGPAKQWFTPIGYGLLAIGLVAGGLQTLFGRNQRTRESPTALAASDDYSDLQLGRRPITHYPRDEASTSQIGDPPQHREPPLD